MKKFDFGEIKSEKLREIQKLKEKRSLIQSIIKAKENGLNPVIAEIKRESPSSGKIRDISIAKAAIQMEKGGACAISVLTDKYFGGCIEDLKIVKNSVKIPVLRKDFIVDEFQIYESYANGADAILLIGTLLKERTKNFVKKAHELGMEALVEIHSNDELGFALNSGARLVGINNRDLRTFKIGLGTTEILGPEIPGKFLRVSESGIKEKGDLNRVFNAGADAVLIGTGIMLSRNIERKVREFVQNGKGKNLRDNK